MGKNAKVIVGTAAVLGLTAFVLIAGFRIDSMDLSGNERYSFSQISGDLVKDYWSGNTLYFVWKYHNPTTSTDAPYLDSIQASMVSPREVRVTVSEKKLTGYVVYNGSYVYFDSEGVVQEISDKVYGTVPMVGGVTMSEPVLYQRLSLDNAATLRTMLSICQLLGSQQLIPDSVTFDENSNMTLTFASIEVKLGQDEYLEEKIANLVQIYPDIAASSGTLNMEGFTGKNEAITFRQDTYSEDQTEGPIVAGLGDVFENAGQSQSETAAAADGSADTAEGGDAAGDGVGADGFGESAEGADAAADGSGSAEDGGDTAQADDTAGDEANADSQEDNSGQVGVDAFQAFDSNGRLRQDAHVVNGQVVDSTGTPIPGCRIDENGNVVDAYWNVIDPHTGTLAQ